MRRIVAAAAAIACLAGPALGAGDLRRVRAGVYECRVTTGGTPLQPEHRWYPCDDVRIECGSTSAGRGTPVSCSYRATSDGRRSP